MNVIVVFSWIILTVTSQAWAKCEQEIICHDHALNKLVNDQIKVELQGHYTYLYLSQIFDQHTRHFPQVTKYLRAKSSEELSHAERFMEYQNQRGGKVQMPSVTRYLDGKCKSVKNITIALGCAMELEAFVTSRLMDLHNNVENIVKSEACEAETIDSDDLRLTQPLLVTCRMDNSAKDQKVVNWKECNCTTISSVAYVELEELIAHDFLGHQVEDTKEIANYYYTIKKMQNGAKGTKELADFLFDKHLDL